MHSLRVSVDAMLDLEIRALGGRGRLELPVTATVADAKAELHARIGAALGLPPPDEDGSALRLVLVRAEGGAAEPLERDGAALGRKGVASGAALVVLPRRVPPEFHAGMGLGARTDARAEARVDALARHRAPPPPTAAEVAAAVGAVAAERAAGGEAAAAAAAAAPRPPVAPPPPAAAGDAAGMLREALADPETEEGVRALLGGDYSALHGFIADMQSALAATAAGGGAAGAAAGEEAAFLEQMLALAGGGDAAAAIGARAALWGAAGGEEAEGEETEGEEETEEEEDDEGEYGEEEEEEEEDSGEESGEWTEDDGEGEEEESEGEEAGGSRDGDGDADAAPGALPPHVPPPSPALLAQLEAMGFEPGVARNAALLARGRPHAAVEWALAAGGAPGAGAPLPAAALAAVYGPPPRARRGGDARAAAAAELRQTGEPSAGEPGSPPLESEAEDEGGPPDAAPPR